MRELPKISRQNPYLYSENKIGTVDTIRMVLYTIRTVAYRMYGLHTVALYAKTSFSSAFSIQLHELNGSTGKKNYVFLCLLLLSQKKNTFHLDAPKLGYI